MLAIDCRSGGVRSALVVGVALVVLVATATTGVNAHGWSVTVDSQTTSDGTVVVGSVTTLERSYVAIHVREGGEPGRVVGHTAIGSGEFSNLEVALDDSFWSGVSEPTDLVAVIHENDGDGTFEYPDGDQIFLNREQMVTSNFTVARSDNGSTRVVATHQSSNGNVTLDRVDLAQDGFVVLTHADESHHDDSDHEEDGEQSEIVGVRYLTAGHHENVTVAVAPRYYNQQDNRLTLTATVYVDDGDGEFDHEQDSPVHAGETPIATHVDAEKISGSIPTPSPTATPESTPTPSPTPTPEETPTETPSADTATPSPTPGVTDATTSTPTATTGPGFGVTVAVLTLLSVLLLAVRQRGRR